MKSFAAYRTTLAEAIPKFNFYLNTNAAQRLWFAIPMTKSVDDDREPKHIRQLSNSLAPPLSFWCARAQTQIIMFEQCSDNDVVLTQNCKHYYDNIIQYTHTHSQWESERDALDKLFFFLQLSIWFLII